MKWRTRYLLSVLPFAIFFIGWGAAIWAYGYFNCTGNLKNLAPCHASSFNLLPWLGLGLFWCQILSWLAAPISAFLIIETAARHIGSLKR